MSQTAQDHFNRGLSLCKEQKYDEGIYQFDLALKLQPNHFEALYNRAKALFKTQKFKQSVADFSSLVKAQPGNAFIYSERAVAYHLSGNNDAALRDLDKAVELEPSKPFRYSSRAFIKDKMGDLEGAISDYEKTIELDPDDAIAYNNKGLVEEKLGYKERAQNSYDKADKLDPNFDPKKKKVSSPSQYIENEESKKDRTPKPPEAKEEREEKEKEAQKHIKVPEIVVKDVVAKSKVFLPPVDGYKADQATGSTRTALPIAETPSSIGVVTRDIIEDTLSLTQTSVFEQVSGVSGGATRFGRGEQFNIRGFNLGGGDT